MKFDVISKSLILPTIALLSFKYLVWERVILRRRIFPAGFSFFAILAASLAARYLFLANREAITLSFSLIQSRQSGRLTSVRAVQPKKDALPLVIFGFYIVTLSSEVHPSNERHPIFLTPSGIVTLFRDL